MLDNIFYLITNFFVISAVIRFLDIFFDAGNKNQKIFYLTGTICWLVNSICCIFFQTPIINLLSSISGLLFVSILSYKGKMWKKILAVFSTLAVSVLIEDLAGLIFGYIPGKGNHIANVFTALFLFLAKSIIDKTLNFKEKAPLPKSYYYCMMVPPALSMVILVLLIKIQNNIQNMAFMTIGVIFILILNLLMLYFFDRMFAYYNEIWEKRFLEKKIAMYENQLEIIRQSKEKEHALRHDLKNHLFLLAEYERKGKSKEVLSYIEKINQFVTVEKEIVNTGNEPIDAILNYMLEKAANSGANLRIKINIPKTEFCSSFDLNILLTNLLENAIEALDTCPEKNLQFIMRLDRGVLFIQVGNSFDGQVKKDGSRYLTRKEDKKVHGIELKNVQSIVDKYNGAMEITQKDKMFYVNIFLYM